MNNSNILFAVLILVLGFVSIHSLSSSIDATQIKNNIINTIIDASSSTGIVTAKDTPKSLPAAAYAQPLKNNNNSNMIVTAKLEDPFQLAINQTAVIAANNMSMQFLDVPEDSVKPRTSVFS